MTLLGTGFRRILILAIIAICLILVALNVILNIKLRSEIPGLIQNFSNNSPYEIKVEVISLDPLFRVRFDKVSVIDPTSELKDVLNVDQVTVNPQILSSLLNQKINLGEIVLNKPVAQSNQENINNLLNYIKTLTKDDKEGSSVDVGSFKILYGDFHITPDFVLSIPDLLLNIDTNNLNGGRNIDFIGQIGLFEIDLITEGNVILSSSDTSGQVRLQIDNISANQFKNLLDGSEKLSAAAEASFQVADSININGKLALDKSRELFGENSLVNADYVLNYDIAKDQATVTKLDFKFEEILNGSFSGEINQVMKETVFNLSGEVNSIDLRDVIVKLFGDDNGVLSGELETKEVDIKGSREKNNIIISANTVLNDFKYQSENEDDPSVNELNCALKLSQSLNSNSGFKLTSKGSCNAEEFAWVKTGPVNTIKAYVNLDSKQKWQDNSITLSNITSQYMDGNAVGSLIFSLDQGFGGGITKISGDIDGSNLNLEKTPKTIIPANIAGSALNVSTKFEGGNSNYKADILATIDSFLLKSNKGREFRLSKMQTQSPVNFEYKSVVDEDQENKTPSQDDIIIKGSSISYENLSFEEYLIQSGNVKSLDFLLELGNDRWSLDMSSEGTDFTIRSHDVSLKQFSESLQIENSGREGFSGTVQGEGGRYKSTEFPELSWDYDFIGDRVIVSNVATQISTLGQFKTDELFVNIGNQVGGYPYKINFTDATFSGFDGKLNSTGIKGNIGINKPGTSNHDWQGNVSVKNTKIVSAEIENISNSIIPRPGGIKLENVQGEFLGGDITGEIDIDTTTSPSGIETNLKLVNASINSNSLEVSLPEANLKFSGTLPNGGLPEGKGTLSLNSMVLQNESHSSKLSASIETETVAETLYVKQGFIKGISNEEIRFTGEMNNSLNENRTLKLNFPDMLLPSALGMFSPMVPEGFRGFKTKGYADLKVTFENLFYPQEKWGGKLNLKNSSLSGKYGGALLTLSDINGTITIKDNVSSKNPLALVMGEHLKLSKSIFQKYLKSFKDSNLEKEDLDFLTIKQIDYGILTFENVEVALEIDREKINLRRFLSKLFRGSLYGAGLLKFNSDQSDYNLSLIFNEISLESISERLSPNQEYITGRLNGLLWLSGEGAQLDTIDGPFKFWSKKSSKEPRKIGQALLNQLGARERLVLGSYRSYDNADISGYINDGLITFKVFSLTNRVLGFKNLSIQADPVRNSITIAHLISVIRELARRSETGGPTIETN